MTVEELIEELNKLPPHAFIDLNIDVDSPGCQVSLVRNAIDVYLWDSGIVRITNIHFSKRDANAL